MSKQGNQIQEQDSARDDKISLICYGMERRGNILCFVTMLPEYFAISTLISIQSKWFFRQYLPPLEYRNL